MTHLIHAHDSRFLKLSAILALALVLATARPAAATPIAPLSCAGPFNTGGCAPYGHIEFATGDPSGSGSLYEYDETVVLDHSVSGPTANVRGVVDLSDGLLRVHAEGIAGTGGYVIASGTDVFTLSGASPSGVVTFGVELTAHGFGWITEPFHTGQATLQLGVPGGGSGAFDLATYQAPGNAPLNMPFSLLSTARPGTPLHAVDTHTMPLDTQFTLSYSLRATVSQGTTFDLMNTARLTFMLPDGITISSLGGYSAGGATAPAPVPEPATLALLSSGLLVAARLRPRCGLRRGRPQTARRR